MRFMARGVGVEMLIKHEAKPSALPCNDATCVFQLYNCFLLVFIFILNGILH